MAKVKLLVGFARTEESWQRGDIVEVSSGEAEAMIAAGYAELAEKTIEQVEIPEKKIKKPINRRKKK